MQVLWFILKCQLICLNTQLISIIYCIITRVVSIRIRSINVHYNIAVFGGRFFFSFHLSFVNLILRWMSCCRIYSFEFNTFRRKIFIFKNSLHKKKIVSFFFTDGKYYKNNLILTDFFFHIYEGVTQNGDPHHKIHM